MHFGDIPTWISALVALASAIAAAVAALRARSAKDAAAQQAKDAVTTAEEGAAHIGRIASVLESRYAPQENKQAFLVFIATSPMIRGETGWVIKNGSDAPISKLKVSAVNSQLLLYTDSRSERSSRARFETHSGPDTQDKFEEAMLAPGESTNMFRPWHADYPEMEQIRFSFEDAQGVPWERVGTGAPVRSE